MGYFSCGEMMPSLLCLRQQIKKSLMNEDKRLEMDVKVFVGRKNVVVSKLYLTFEILTATFGIKPQGIVL